MSNEKKMKKIISICIILSMILSFSACNSKQTNTQEKSADALQASTEEKSTNENVDSLATSVEEESVGENLSNAHSVDSPETSDKDELDEIIEKVRAELEENEYTPYPATFSQVTYKMLPNDSFGEGNGCTPLTRVIIEEGDIKRKGKLGLSFDCAYVLDNLVPLLTILDAYDLKATFFGTQEFVKNNPDAVPLILSHGHEFGSHSTTHAHFNDLTDEEVVREMLTNEVFVKKVYGLDMCLFRYPYGEANPHNMNIMRRLGYYPINWAFDSLDWKNEGTQAILNRVVAHNFTEGEVLLFHVSGNYTPEALPVIIEYVHNLGLEFTKLSDLIYTENFTANWGNQRTLVPVVNEAIGEILESPALQ